jgi:hypothetical protein
MVGVSPERTARLQPSPIAGHATGTDPLATHLPYQQEQALNCSPPVTVFLPRCKGRTAHWSRYPTR